MFNSVGRPDAIDRGRPVKSTRTEAALTIRSTSRVCSSSCEPMLLILDKIYWWFYREELLSDDGWVSRKTIYD
jgi:hypothetical protein